MKEHPPVILVDHAEPVHYENLFLPLFHKALPRIKGWATDLGHDVLILSRAEPGDVLVWSWRETGTHLFDLEECADHSSVTQSMTPPENWYLIQIEGRHGQGLRYAKGWLTPIGHADAATVVERLRSARNRLLESRVAAPQET